MRNKISEIVSSLLIGLFGLSLVLWADKVTNIISILLGIVFGIMGVIKIISYYRFGDTNSWNLIIGLITIVIGGVLIFKVNLLKEIFSFVVGLYIILSSITSFLVTLKMQKVAYHKLTGSIVLSIIGILAGAICLFGRVFLPDVFLKIIGFMMLVYGITNFINTLLLNSQTDF